MYAHVRANFGLAFGRVVLIRLRVLYWALPRVVSVDFKAVGTVGCSGQIVREPYKFSAEW